MRVPFHDFKHILWLLIFLSTLKILLDPIWTGPFYTEKDPDQDRRFVETESKIHAKMILLSIKQ